MSTDVVARGYHHGDLRNALLEGALELLESGGPESLSLRAVARAAGVSHAAPYHHFADKAALVEAVAIHGFQLLADRMRAGIGTVADPIEQFRQTGLCYGRFALDHEELFRLMNRSELRRGASVAAAAHDSYLVVEDAVRACQRAGAMQEGEPGAYARTAWAAVHGAVLLHLDGLIEQAGATDGEQFVDEVTCVLGTGFLPR